MNDKKDSSGTHTPGPWGWYDDNMYPVAPYEAYRRSVAANDFENVEYPIAIVETDSGHYGPFGADRDLIAAAPEMYAALKYVEEYLTSTPYGTDLDAELPVVRAAIAKAEGAKK